MLKNPDAVLLLGHGSRIEHANAPLGEMARLVGERLGVDTVSVAFLQLAEPTLADAAERLVAQGKRRIVVVPFFLFAGAHVMEDIPQTFTELRHRHPEARFTLCKPLGMHPLLAEIACQRVRERLEEDPT